MKGAGRADRGRGLRVEYSEAHGSGTKNTVTYTGRGVNASSPFFLSVLFLKQNFECLKKIIV